MYTLKNTINSQISTRQFLYYKWGRCQKWYTKWIPCAQPVSGYNIYICYGHASENRSTGASPNFAVHGFTLLANKKIKHDTGFIKNINLARKKKGFSFWSFLFLKEHLNQSPKMPHKFSDKIYFEARNTVKTVSLDLPIHRQPVCKPPTNSGFPMQKGRKM